LKLTLVDHTRRESIEILIESQKDHLVQGVVVSHNLTPEVSNLFKEFEYLVNNFVIGELLDDVSTKIDSYGWRSIEKEWIIRDLQIFEMKLVSFRIQKTRAFDQVDLIAEISFLTTSQGGRKNTVESGYRPHIQFQNYPSDITSGNQTYLGEDKVHPGQTVFGEIALLNKDLFADKLFIGMNFEFFEGKHKIGHGTIQEIVNEKLAIKS